MSEARTPGPGQGTLRIPFVELYIGNRRLPLLDASGAGGDGLLLQKFTYTISNKVAMGNALEITIIDPQWQNLENLIIANITTRGQRTAPQFSFRFGWRGIDDVEGRLPIAMQIIDYGLVFNSFGGTYITIFAMDQGFQLSVSPSTRGFDANEPISSVIEQVIEEIPGLVANVEPILYPVGEQNCRIENRTRMQYIMDLLDIARGTDSRNNFVVTSTVLPSGVTQVNVTQNKERDEISKRYIFGRERVGEMIQFAPKYQGIIMSRLGADRAEAIGYDPVKKTYVKATSDKTEDKSTAPKDITDVPLTPFQIWEVPYKNLGDVEAYVRGRRETANFAGWPAEATIYGDTSLLPQQQVQVLVLMGNPRNEEIQVKHYHNTSGVYLVQGVIHTIYEGVFRTGLEMIRHRGYLGHEAGGLIVSSISNPISAGKVRIDAERIEVA